MANNGWIKLHRKLLENPKMMADNDYWVVWTKLLLLVQFQSKKALFKTKIIDLKPGQIITTRSELVTFCNVERSKLERVLKWLESEQQIEQQSTNVNRLISIKNWKKYQEIEQQSEQQVSNKRATSEQPLYKYKEREEREEERESSIPEGKTIALAKSEFEILKSKLDDYFNTGYNQVELFTSQIRFKGNFQEELISFYSWHAAHKPEYARLPVDKLLNHLRKWLTNKIAKESTKKDQPEKQIYTPAKNYNPRG